MPPQLPITVLFVGLFALIQVPLTMMVGWRRAQTVIPFLDGGDPTLLRRMRAHANFTETVPMVLLAMAMSEWTGLASVWLWAGGLCLLGGRALHAYWTLRHGWGTPRATGMLLTFAPMLGFGGWLLSRGL
ncbi:MAG: MAPEG family protein [Burkholderiales bacterium]|nr:MAPEG family protein [Burkholderiales bacterium]